MNSWCLPHILVQRDCDSQYALRNEENDYRVVRTDGLNQQAGNGYTQWLTAESYQAKDAVDPPLQAVGNDRNAVGVLRHAIDGNYDETDRVRYAKQQWIGRDSIKEPR